MRTRPEWTRHSLSAGGRLSRLLRSSGQNAALGLGAAGVFLISAILTPMGVRGLAAAEPAGAMAHPWGVRTAYAVVGPCVSMRSPMALPGLRSFASFWRTGGVEGQAWLAWTVWGCRRMGLEPVPVRDAAPSARPEQPATVVTARPDQRVPEPDAPAAKPDAAPAEPVAPVLPPDEAVPDLDQPAPQRPEPQHPAPQPAPPLPEHGAPAAQPLPEPVAEMLQQVNRERAQRGLQPLALDPQLSQLAQLKAEEMVRLNYFSHRSPVYGSPFDMLRRFGVDYRMAGENIAGNSSVAGAHASLMNSPGHRANILKPGYTHVGIGIAEGGPYGMMFTQLFVGR